MGWGLRGAKGGCGERGKRVFMKDRKGGKKDCVHLCVCVCLSVCLSTFVCQ